MLGVAPALISYVLLENLALAITFGVIAVVLAAAVYLLSLMTHWKIIPRIVDLMGMVLTPVYVAIAVWIWMGL